MLLKIFMALSLASLMGCGKGPKIILCVFHHESQEFLCVDKTGQNFDVVATNSWTDNLVCLPRGDAEEYFKWCNRK